MRIQSIILPFACLSILVHPIKARPDHAGHLDATVITIQSPLSTMFEGYLNWLHHHPQAGTSASADGQDLSKGTPSTAAGTSLRVSMPSIDLYSPSGVSLYHGTNSEKNATFIRGLLPGGPPRHMNPPSEPRPTLQEALAIFPQFRPYETSVLANRMYTVFAMTYPNQSKYKEQNDAIEQLRGRARELHIRVIEVQVLLKK